MTKPILFIEKKDSFLEVDISAIPDWEGFDKIIFFLKNEYNIKVLSIVDGPGSRRWVLDVEGVTFELIHDDGYGNYMVACSSDSEVLVRKIGKDLETRLKNL